ncbi:MAG: arylesterase [Candidatus Omnitrophica bacterium]|nr:arylesterase [Candidatus Omnitrophota bacterium]
MLNRKYFFAITMCLAALLACGCEAKVRNLNSPGGTIVCFGDSITYGTGADRSGDYPSLLSDLLRRDLINAGVPGDTTRDALARLDSDVLELDPYLVIVELGGNDFLEGLPKQETLANLREIISRIQGSGAIVALCDVSGGVIMSGYRKDYRRLARETASIFIPRLMEGILVNPAFKYDEIHPNSKGYKIIAEKVYRAVRKYVK